MVLPSRLVPAASHEIVMPPPPEAPIASGTTAPELLPIPSTTSHVTVDRSAVIAQRELDVAESARRAQYVGAFLYDVRTRAFKELHDTRSQIPKILSTLEDTDPDAPAWLEVRESIEHDRLLAEDEAEGERKIAGVFYRLSRDRDGVQERARSDLHEMQEALDLVRRARAELRIACPAIGLIDAQKVDLSASNETLREVFIQAAKTRDLEIADVARRLHSGDIPLHRLDRLVTRMFEEQGISPASTDERSLAILEWQQGEARKGMVLNIGATAAAIVLSIGAAVSGIGMIAVLAGGIGLATAAVELEEAIDIDDIADTSLSPDEALADRAEARQERAFAYVNLAFAAADVFGAVRSLRGAAKIAAVSSEATRAALSSTRGAFLRALPTEDLAALEHAFRGAVPDEAALVKLSRRTTPELFARAKTYFAERAATLQALPYEVPEFERLYAVLGREKLIALTSRFERETLARLVNHFGPARAASLIVLHGESSVHRIMSTLDPAAAERLFRALGPVRGVSSILDAASPQLLSNLADELGTVKLRGWLKTLQSTGLAHVHEALGPEGLVALARQGVSTRILEELRHELHDPNLRSILSRAYGRDVAELLASKYRARTIAEVRTAIEQRTCFTNLDLAARAQLAAYKAGTIGANARRLAVTLREMTDAELLATMKAEVATGKATVRTKADGNSIWEYADGTVVRHKPKGDRLRQTPTYCVEVKKDPLAPDEGLSTIAFKVSPEGAPIPREPKHVGGPAHDKPRWIWVLMNAGHRRLRR
jgi:hypothetical protein